MAFVIKYQILFEVKIFHGFYHKDEGAFYGKDEVEKAIELIDNNYNILNDLEIIPTGFCKKLLAGHQLKFKASPFGFLVGIETKVNDSGDIFPKIPIAEGTVFHFRIKLKNSNWSSISNVRLKPNTRAKYYFSNFEQTDSLQTTTEPLNPTLALKHADFNADRPYEMGEIILDTDGATLKRALQNTDGSNPPSNGLFWEPINELQNVGDANRKLLPSRFNYHILPNAGLTLDDVTFELKKSDGSREKLINFDPLENQSIINLDFRRLEEERLINLPVGEYILEVSSSGDYGEKIPIHIDDNLFNHQDWGAIAISHKNDLSDYRILENDGRLRVKGGEARHPKFEIRLKNRATYWKYIFHPGNTFTPSPDPSFETNAKYIITKDLFPISRFSNDTLPELGGNKLPHPTDWMIKQNDTKTKFLSEIYLPKMSIS